jgi:CheY-like chemotaxis protein
MRNRRVLLYIDDCKHLRYLIEEAFHQRYPLIEIVALGSAQEALAKLETRKGTSGFPATVFTDAHLGPANQEGLWLIREMRSRFPSLRVIAVTGALSDQIRKDARAAGAHVCFEKDMSLDSFVTRLFDWIQCPTDLLPSPATVTS